MSVENEYSKREIDIFKAVIKLMKEGENPYTMTVSDIAKAADIGKGTIYSYFSTKEEVISNGIVYYLNTEVEEICDKITREDNFKSKYYKVLEIINYNLKKEVSPLSIAYSERGIKGFYNHVSVSTCNKMKHIETFNLMIDDLVKTAYEENIISRNEDEFYYKMAIRGGIFSFSHFLKWEEYKDMDIEEVKDVAYRIVMQTLK